MEEKMDTDRSFSGESSSSSDSSSGSSDGDEDSMEPVRVLGQTLELPQKMCEDYGVFKDILSMKTWESLDDKHKERLKALLPQFPENQEEETDKTIKMLFNYEPFHFTSPLNVFFNHLKQGNYRPDIAKMRKFLMRARVKQHKHKMKSYYAKLLPEVLIARERILAAARSAPPGPIPPVPPLPPRPSSKNNFKPIYLRAKQRYFEELAAIRTEVGGVETDDENYPEGPPEPSNKRRKQFIIGPNGETNISGTLGGSDSPHSTSLQGLKIALAAHRSRRQYREIHPELNTSGITLEDIKQRVALVNGTKKLMFGGQKVASPVLKIKKGGLKKEARKLSEGKGIRKCKEEIEPPETRPLLPNIKIKCEQEESDSESSSFVDPVASPRQNKKSCESVEIKQEVVDKYPNMTNSNYDPSLEIKQEPPDVIPVPCSNSSKMSVHQPVPIKLEDLDGIDMMALPVELADDSGEFIQVESSDVADEPVVQVDESLTETTHACFLSLVRALFPARDAHRASKQQLHARCAAVMRSPIAPLNTWYNLSDDWCSELDSALDFLAGERGSHPEDFVPYLQYMPETQVGSEETMKIYQWIGAGRDCDAILGRLCERWLRASSPQPCAKEIPPPKYPTSWTVRPPTSADIAEFRSQERRRFTAAAKPFTYVQHGYRSVVGPCARWSGGGWASGGGSGGGGGWGAGLLCAERPRHAAFVALVRDALARLPNGEGTRHDVLTLIKMSQYISQCSDQALLGAVSAVLERLSAAKRDPVVKYDPRTAIWTYLHRNRSEEDWLSKCPTRRSKVPPLPPPSLPPPPPPLTEHNTPSHAMELEVGSTEEVIEASDSDVDVDDSSTPPAAPHLSSAQLLMQATQTQHKPTPKPKKQPTPQKRPYIKLQQKQTKAALMTQSVKQANLLAQAVKTQAKANPTPVKNITKAVVIQTPKPAASKPMGPKTQLKVTQKVTVKPPAQSPKQVASPKQAAASPKQVVASPKHAVASPKPPPSPKQPPPSPKPPQSPKQIPSPKSVAVSSVKTVVTQSVTLPVLTQTTITKSIPSVLTTKSPLLKQRPLLKSDANLITVNKVPSTSVISQPQTSTTPTVIQPIASTSLLQTQNKLSQVTRSLLIRPPGAQTTVTAAITVATTQVANARRGVVRVLSPANPSSGKSLISPRALLQDTPAFKKRVPTVSTISVSSVTQTMTTATTVISAASTSTAVTSAPRTVQLAATRSVQLPSGQTVQLPTGQTVQLPTGQTVQLPSGQTVQLPSHTLQLSSLQLPTHSVRLPNGQTVQLATPQTMQALKASKNPQGPRTNTVKSNVQVPISTVQLAGQTVQIAGQTVQLAGQSVQLTGHTVKLPSGQSVPVASQSVIPPSVQLPSGHTVQLAGGNVQAVQIAGSNVQISGTQLGSQTVQIGGQTVQLASGQTLQFTSGQTLQLASGQTVQLANQTTKSMPQVVRSQADKTTTGQPIVAKLLTNAQGQMVSLEGLSNSRALMSGVKPRPAVRVLSPAARLTRPLLLTSAKPLHNIILQQSDGAVRATSTGTTTTSQTIVISNIATQTVTTPSTSTPVLKIQQVNPIHQVKLGQGIKLQQPVSTAQVATSSGVRSVLMDGQQLKLVGGRHVLARILRPAHPPNQ